MVNTPPPKIRCTFFPEKVDRVFKLAKMDLTKTYTNLFVCQ